SCVFFKQKTAYEIETGLEFRRVLFRSAPTPPTLNNLIPIELLNKEYYKVFVCIVEIPRIKFVIVVEKLCLCVVVRCYSSIKIANAQRITVEHYAQHARNFDGFVTAFLDINVTRASKLVVLSAALPKRYGFGLRQKHIATVERVGIKIGLRCLCKVGQKYNV